MTQREPLQDRNNWLVLPAAMRDCVPDHFEVLEVDGFIFARCWDGRFKDDRCLESTARFGLLFDGVLLNRRELLQETARHSVAELLVGLIEGQGLHDSLARLRGVFGGVIFDRDARTLHAFGNQTGESAAFFFQGSIGPVISNSFDLMMRVFGSAGVGVTFDGHAAQVMLSYGFMIDDHTFAREVRRIRPGGVASVDLAHGSVAVSDYWRLDTSRSHRTPTIEGAVEELDRLFRRAVARCFDKDREYGYRRHLVDLSAGMDARMVNVVARDLGYDSITNVTYGESRSDDSRYAVRLAVQLGNDCLQHPLDGGRSLLDPELNLRLNSGMAYYGGITGGRFVLSSLDFTEFGLEHTGIMGDSVVGTYAKSATRRPPRPGTGAYSSVNIYPAELDGSDEELFFLETNGFRGVTSTPLLRQHFTFAVSPFTDIDLIEHMVSLPLEWRHGHRLYARWVRTRYPRALDVPVARPLPAAGGAPLRHVHLLYRRGFAALSRRSLKWFRKHSLQAPWLATATRGHMNPFDSWFATNAELRRSIHGAAEQAVDLPVPEDVRSALRDSFGPSGSVIDKLLGVTVVTMHSLYFANGRKPASVEPHGA